MMALAALTLIVPVTANANIKNQTVDIKPTLAILDTALDTSLPEFKDKIVYEVCILEWPSCANGKVFMEGPGAAGMDKSFIVTRDFNHGTQMTSVALQNNPNMNVIFIRIVGNTKTGVRQTTGPTGVASALDWIFINKDRFNIKAVSMSQGHHNLINRAQYCPINTKVSTSLNKLLSVGIPAFFAAGNGRDYKRIDWPACHPEAIAVGATDQFGEIAIYSNADSNLLDFYANGSARVSLPGGSQANAAGTSVSAQVAAAQWVAIATAKPTLTYSQIYDLLSKTSKQTKSATVPLGKLIDLAGALNG